jgi:D-glycero-beta-D-manno-heptose 1-phosphate adenylyltransferase
MRHIFNFTTEKEEITELINNFPLFSKIVFTNGVFDLIHPNHINLLNESKQLGDILIVGMNSDKSTKLLKGEKRPIIKEDDRAFMLINLKAVDYVIIFDEFNVIDLIKFIKPNIITKGGEYKIEELNDVGGDYMKEINGSVVIIPNKKNVSTSKIINEIIEIYDKIS